VTVDVTSPAEPTANGSIVSGSAAAHGATTSVSALHRRALLLDAQLANLPFNVDERTALLQFGYSAKFFGSNPSVTADTYSVTGDENLSGTLSAVFQEYVGLLQRVGVAEITLGQTRTVLCVWGQNCCCPRMIPPPPALNTCSTSKPAYM
jgi:hypothetical protein